MALSTEHVSVSGDRGCGAGAFLVAENPPYVIPGCGRLDYGLGMCLMKA